jgi:hypothetical protein
MIYYQSPQELIDFLYSTFLNIMAGRGVDAYTGSGMHVPALLQGRISEEIDNGNIPAAYHMLSGTQSGERNLYLIEDNVVFLANQLADDAIAANTAQLHEWSLSNVKRRLCPLYPFFREPCSQYDPLVEA